MLNKSVFWCWNSSNEFTSKSIDVANKLYRHTNKNYLIVILLFEYSRLGTTPWIVSKVIMNQSSSEFKKFRLTLTKPAFALVGGTM